MKRIIMFTSYTAANSLMGRCFLQKTLISNFILAISNVHLPVNLQLNASVTFCFPVILKHNIYPVYHSNNNSEDLRMTRPIYTS